MLNEVNLYISTSAHGFRKMDGAFAWVLEAIKENGEPDSRTRNNTGIREKTTDRALVLEAIAQALDRLTVPCNVTIYLDPAYLIETFPVPWANGWVDKWEAAGWVTETGKPIAETEKWKNAKAAMQIHDISFARISDQNPYKSWLINQIDNAIARYNANKEDHE